MRTHRQERDPAKILSLRRGELSMTQGEVAKKLGYDNPNFISILEKGRSKIPLEKAIDIAEALEMDVKWFVEMVMRDRIPTVADLLFGSAPGAVKAVKKKAA